MKRNRPHKNGRRCTTFAGLGLNGDGLDFRFSEEDLPRTPDRFRAIAALLHQYHEIAGLSPDEWAAVEPRYCQDRSISAISRDVGVSRRTVRRRIRAGLVKILDYGLTRQISS